MTEKESAHPDLPRNERPDTLARAAGAEARRALEEEAQHQYGSMVFTKGNNSPTLDQVGLPYTTEDMNLPEHGPARGADVPGGSGATPLAADRDDFINTVLAAGNLDSVHTATQWTTAIFNAIRDLALSADKTVMDELGSVVRAGEAPEVQIQEMLWGGDYPARLARLLQALPQPKKTDLYQSVARFLPDKSDEVQIADAVSGFLYALRQRLDDQEANLNNLGELQAIWEQARPR